MSDVHQDKLHILYLLDRDGVLSLKDLRYHLLISYDEIKYRIDKLFEDQLILDDTSTTSKFRLRERMVRIDPSKEDIVRELLHGISADEWSEILIRFSKDYCCQPDHFLTGKVG